MFGINRLVWRADQKRRSRFTRRKRFQMGLAIESVFAVFVARLNLDQPHIEPRVSVGCESQCPGYVDRPNRPNRPNRLVAGDVVFDLVSFTNQHTSANAGHKLAFPRRSGRPSARASRPNHRGGKGTGLAAGCGRSRPCDLRRRLLPIVSTECCRWQLECRPGRTPLPIDFAVRVALVGP